MLIESDSKIFIGSGIFLFIDLLDDDSDFEVISKFLVWKLLFVKLVLGKRKFIKIISFDELSDSV